MNGSTLTEERRRKLAHNQALFREVNDRIHELAAGMRGGQATFQIVCECSDESCTEFIAVAVEEYQPVREFAARFLIRPGHEIPEIERVVSQANEYVVVEKIGPAATAVTQALQEQRSRVSSEA